MINNTMRGLLLILLMTGVSAVSAQDSEKPAEPPTPEMKFERADSDGNGCVSWEELRNQGAIIFATLDLNNDGVIAGDEHPKAVNAKGEKVQPNSVDLEAFNAAFREAFERADQDASECLDKKEFLS